MTASLPHLDMYRMSKTNPGPVSKVFWVRICSSLGHPDLSRDLDGRESSSPARVRGKTSVFLFYFFFFFFFMFLLLFRSLYIYA